MDPKKINSALISVFDKTGLDAIVSHLKALNIQIFSTGGTEKYINNLGIPVTPVEDLTGFPSIFDGRVKTLHPAIFGGILSRRENDNDKREANQHSIPEIDLVIVDLYPFENTVASSSSEEEIIEKIDIGGISLIRAAAKNYNDVVIIPSMESYPFLLDILEIKQGHTDLSDRKHLARLAFNVTSHYDTAIFNYFNKENSIPSLKVDLINSKQLRYGENPHQKSRFYGDLDQLFEIINGKELSYNNLVDVDACISLIDEFPVNEKQNEITFAIIKHTNACGVATASSPLEAYITALSCDPVSAFGGVIITNGEIDLPTAEEISKIFYEVLIAPSYTTEALKVLKEKKNRIILLRKPLPLPLVHFKTLLNGVIEQDKDIKIETEEDLKTVTSIAPTEYQIKALLFANKIVKHTKSNTIVLSTDNMLLASGVGQTSRVDALNQAIEKAKHFNINIEGAVMASDAFFPFPDCVEIAHKAGISAVLQPGGSVKDNESIEYCNQNNLSMVFTGTRHFKH